MSAPPMGITSATPNTRASKAMAAMSSIGVIAESTGGVPPGIEAEMRKTERSTTAPAIEERDHRRHRGHLHHRRADEAGDPADRDPRQDERNPAPDVRGEERRDDRDEHARRRDAVSLNRRRRRGQTFQSENEGDRRDEIGDRDERLDGHSVFRVGRCLNIASIRSVTTNPPTTFAVPSTTARKPRTTPR